ncbi:MAG: hypothetical protein GYA87_05625 [Christensenellaceae bacterium]|nr:hypothetical protein [Christensenellaceae bacterium]
MSNKPGFMFYHEDFKAICEVITDGSDFKKLVSMLMDYSENQTYTKSDNMAINAFFTMLKQKIDRDSIKYENTIEARREAGRLGGLAKQRNKNKMG